MNLRLSALLLTLSGLGIALAPAQDSNLASFDLVVNNQVRRIVIQLDDKAAPQTAANFKELVSKGFYNGLAVHRAIPGYLVQLGDPLTRDNSQRDSWGTGDPGHTVPAEIKLPQLRGSVAMARLPDGRNPTRASNGSQFYIALADLPHLSDQYTVFGQVIRGIEHLDFVADQTVDTNDVPVRRIEVAGAVVGTGSSGGGMASLAQTAVTKPISTAAESVRNATSRVSNAVRGDGDGLSLPRPKMPRLPRFGSGSKGADAEAEAALDDVAVAPFEGTPPPSAAMPALPDAPALPVTETVDIEPGATSIPDPEDKTRRFALKMPSLSMPSLPRFGRGRNQEGGDAVASDPSAYADVPLPPELPALPETVADAAAPDAAAAPAGPKPEKQRLVIPVKKSGGSKEKGIVTRAIERVW